MFQRPEFYSADVMGSMVHQPVDWAALLLRAANLGNAMPSSMDQRLADLGQGVFEPPSVAGWKYNQAWLNENAVWMKDEIAASVARDASTAGFLSSILAMDVPPPSRPPSRRSASPRCRHARRPRCRPT